MKQRPYPQFVFMRGDDRAWLWTPDFVEVQSWEAYALGTLAGKPVEGVGFSDASSQLCWFFLLFDLRLCPYVVALLQKYRYMIRDVTACNLFRILLIALYLHSH